MATIQSQLKLNDGMSAVLRSVTTALDTCLSSFEQMQTASGQAIDVENIASARVELMAANSAIEQMESNLQNVENQQNDVNDSFREGGTAANALLGKITSMVAAYMSITAVTGFIKNSLDLSDTQRNAETQLRAVGANIGMTEEAFQSLKDTASSIQSLGIYGDELMLGGAAELSTYLSDAEAISSMMGTLADYAVGMSGGGELSYNQMVDYATQLGKVFSGAYDGITKKGFELTDVQKDIIAYGTDMEKALVMEEIIGESWAGLYEAMSNTPEGKILQFKNALGDIQETIGNQLYPAVLMLFDTFTENLPNIEAAMSGFASMISVVIILVSYLVEALGNGAAWIRDNWELISPAVDAVKGTVMALYTAAQIVIGYLQQGAMWIIENWSAVQAVLAVVAMVLLPIMTVQVLTLAAAWIAANWPVLLVMAAVVALAAIFAKFGITATDVLGAIAGGVNVVIQFFKNLGLSVANIALGIWNALGAVAENIGIAFSNVISNIQGWFWGLVATVLSAVEKIAAALNKLPFVSFDYSGLTAAADEYAAKSAEAYDNVQDYTSISEAFSEGMNTFDAFGEGWVSDAFNSGNEWGRGVADTIGNAIDGFASDFDSLFDTSAYDLDNLGALALDGIGGMNGSLDEIADNTGSTAASLKNMSEDLVYMRDLAEREAINRFTTAEIKVDMTGMTNRIDSNMDVDGIITRFVDGVMEELSVTAEGVHA